jgi:hypothetical protein
MGGTDKQGELRPGKEDRKSQNKPKTPRPAAVEDDEIEDGDIATPKRDRNGDDDQPL